MSVLSELLLELYSTGLDIAMIVIISIQVLILLNQLFKYSLGYVRDEKVVRNGIDRIYLKMNPIVEDADFDAIIPANIIFGAMAVIFYPILILAGAWFLMLKLLRLLVRLSRVSHEHKGKEITHHRDIDWRNK